MVQQMKDKLKSLGSKRLLIYASIFMILFIGLIDAYRIDVNIEDFYFLILYFLVLFILDFLNIKWLRIIYMLIFSIGLYEVYFNSLIMFYRFFQCQGLYFYVENLGSLLSLAFVFFLLIIFVFKSILVEERRYFQIAFLVLFGFFIFSMIIFQLDVFFDILPNCVVQLDDYIFNPPYFPYGIYEYSSIQNVQFLVLGIKDIFYLLLLYTSSKIIKIE